MTCIIGLVKNGKVYIGSDSASANSALIRETKLEKVFRKGKYIIAYTSSFRMGQLLQHVVELPDPPEDVTLEFMVKNFVEAVRVCFKSFGYSKIELNVEAGGCFLVGVKGKLFHIFDDFQVNEYTDQFAADGSGMYYALGAMEALSILEPVKRIKRSMEVAAKFNPFVCLPVVILEVD